MKNISISSVTILYNFNNEVIENIKTYEKYVDEVILIDNSDSNVYYNKYKDALSKYTYISMGENLGIAKALNEGMKYSIEKKYDWCITFDQDTALKSNIIEIYKKYIDMNCVSNAIIYSPLYDFDRKKLKRFSGIREVDYVMQSANLVNLKEFMNLGMFKEDFFIDVVDYEFCLRARKNGYKVISCGEAIVEHNPGITKKIKLLNIKYGYCNKYRIYYQARNLLWTFKKYKNYKILIILLYKFMKIILLFDDKIEFLKYYFKGIKDCLKHNFGNIKQS